MKIMDNKVNLTESNKDFAVFLPAISFIYADLLSKNEKEKYGDRVPKGLPNGLESLKFLYEDKAMFSYKWGLYSAGHAKLDIEKSKVQEAFVQDRPRDKTIILGDSGGFQVAKGIIKFDWDNFFTPGGKNDKIRMDILRWLEHTADWSMCLDIPSFSVNLGIGVNTVKDCMAYTAYNNEWFIKNRVPGATKFLNVIQGNDIPSADEWFDTMAPFSDKKIYGDRAFEGWAMGGEHMRWWKLILHRMIKMRDGGHFDGKDWIHFLGTSALEPAVMLTAIKRQLQKVNPNMEVSFDSASAFVSVARGLVYTENEYDMMRKKPRFGFTMDKAKDNKKYAGNMDRMYADKVPGEYETFVTKSPVMDCYREGDICCRGVDYESKTSWDSLSYVLLMAHNVYQHIEAVQEANRRTDDKDIKSIPENVLEFIDLTERVFASENPMDLIDKNTSLLNKLSKAKFTGAPRTTTFDSIVEETPAFVMKEKKEIIETASNFANLFD
jgi:hypothetical protein|tara:strand:- start:7513 stop:8994 length:1482 start_codon:yes stop_codon:yes gene_type:complete